jgi:hypothetical protein
MDPMIKGAKMLDVSAVMAANRDTGRAFEELFEAYWKALAAQATEEAVALGSEREVVAAGIKSARIVALSAYTAATSVMVGMVGSALQGNVRAMLDLEVLIGEFQRKQADWLAMTAMKNMAAATPKAA